MRKLRLLAIAVAAVAIGALSATSTGHADLAANQTRIPDLRAMTQSDLHQSAWVIYVRYYNGCNRQRWCSARRWDGYKYVYYNCYWGNCVYGGGGRY